MRSYKVTPGQSLVEFALVLPFVLLLIMGLFDVGRAIFYYATLKTATRAGVRYAVVQPDCDYRSDPVSCTGIYESYPLVCTNATSKANMAICGEIVNKFFNIGDLSSSTITIDHFPDPFSGDPEIKISIEYTFIPITPGIALMGDLTMHVNSQMLLAPIAEP